MGGTVSLVGMGGPRQIFLIFLLLNIHLALGAGVKRPLEKEISNAIDSGPVHASIHKLEHRYSQLLNKGKRYQVFSKGGINRRRKGSKKLEQAANTRHDQDDIRLQNLSYNNDNKNNNRTVNRKKNMRKLSKKAQKQQEKKKLKKMLNKKLLLKSKKAQRKRFNKP